MSGVFISYRRTDSDVAAGRLADDLSDILGPGRVFRDIDSLQAGEDFPRALDRALDSCSALIALIGSRWSNTVDGKGQRRLDDPTDWVRLEIARALERDIRVIPVLVSATMPQKSELPDDLAPLLRRHALELTDRHWRQDVEGLAQALERIPGFGPRLAPHPGPGAGAVGFRIPSTAALVALAAALVVAVAGFWVLRSWDASRPASTENGAAAPGPTGEPVDISPWVRIRDSGVEGTVAGLAVASAMEGSLARQKRPVSLSARYLYEKAKTVDRFGTNVEGTDMSAAIYVAENFGAPPEETWPYVAGSRALPKGVTWARLDEEAASFKARTFRLAGFDDIPQHLAQGRPIVAAITVTGAWSGDEAVKTGLIRRTGQDQEVGGSAVVIVGFDPADSSITFANSWGTKWGVNGFGRMSAADAQKSILSMWAIDVPPPEP